MKSRNAGWGVQSSSLYRYSDDQGCEVYRVCATLSNANWHISCVSHDIDYGIWWTILRRREGLGSGLAYLGLARNASCRSYDR